MTLARNVAWFVETCVSQAIELFKAQFLGQLLSGNQNSLHPPDAAEI